MRLDRYRALDWPCLVLGAVAVVAFAVADWLRGFRRDD